MIQFKLFEAKYYPEYISTETQVNEWLRENPNIKVKDFQGNISGYADSGSCATDYYEALYVMYEISDEEK